MILWDIYTKALLFKPSYIEKQENAKQRHFVELQIRKNSLNSIQS